MINKYMDRMDTKHRKVCGVDIVELAEKYGTPLYVLFEEIIEENYKKYQTALENVYENHLICYAVKANTTFAVLKLLGEHGAGADVASEYARVNIIWENVLRMFKTYKIWEVNNG